MEAFATKLEDGSFQAIIHDISERKRSETLQNAVYQISEATDKAKTIDELYEYVHKIVGSVMPADNFYISLYNEEKDLLSFPYFVDELEEPDKPIPPSKGCTAYVLRTGKPLFCDEAVERELSNQGELELMGAHSPIWMGVPLIVENKTIGAMVVQHYTDPDAYTRSDLQMLEYVSSQIGKAIVSKRAEEALKNTKEKLSTLLNNVPVSVYRSTPDGQVLSANPALLRILGYNSEEECCTIKASNSYLNKRRREEYIEELKKFGFVRDFESQMVRKDGTVIWVSANATVTRDENGDIQYIDGTEEDITERKRVEEELKESEERFRSIFNNSTVGFYRTTPEGKIILANPATINILGYDTFDELAERNLEEDGFEHNHTRSEFIRIINEKGEVRDLESAWKHKNGTFIYVRENAKAFKDANGNVIYYEGTVEDITLRKRAEKLQNAVYQISEATGKAKSIDDLYKSVHEIIDSVLPAKNFFISLYDNEKDLLTFPYFVDEIDSPPGPVKAGKGYTAYVLRTGKSVFYDEELDRRLKENGDVEAVGTDAPSWIGIPLIIEDKTIGAMVVQHYSDPDAYTHGDLQMLEYVSSQIAKAIVTKRAEEELLKLSSAVKQSSASIIITDILGNIEYVNPKFTDVTGYSLNEVKGRNTRIMKSGETPPEVYKELWAAISEGKEWGVSFIIRKRMENFIGSRLQSHLLEMPTG